MRSSAIGTSRFTDQIASRISLDKLAVPVRSLRIDERHGRGPDCSLPNAFAMSAGQYTMLGDCW